MTGAADAPPKPGAGAVEAVLDVLASACKVVAGVAIVGLTAIFGWLVWGRYVMNDTPTWVEQIALLLIMLITFLGAAVGVREGTHLSVTLFADAAPPRLRTALAVVAHVVMAGFGALTAWHSAKLTLFKWSSEIPLIHLPEGLRAAPIAVSGALVCLFSLGHLLRILRGQAADAAPGASVGD